MTKTIRLLASLTAIILMSSFTGKNVYGFIGTYGVADGNPSQIRLTINADHTFHYQDLSLPGNKIVVDGTWTLKGSKVVLDRSSGKKFHRVWKFSEDGRVARSRKGLCFYTLSKIRE